MFGTSFLPTYVHSHNSAYTCSDVDIANCQAGDNAYWVSYERGYEREAHKDESAFYEPAHNRSSRKSTQQGTYVSAYEHIDGGNDSVWSTNDEPFGDPADEEDFRTNESDFVARFSSNKVADRQDTRAHEESDCAASQNTQPYQEADVAACQNREAHEVALVKATNDIPRKALDEEAHVFSCKATNDIPRKDLDEEAHVFSCKATNDIPCKARDEKAHVFSCKATDEIPRAAANEEAHVISREVTNEISRKTTDEESFGIPRKASNEET
jgi:hypothetical protein